MSGNERNSPTLTALFQKCVISGAVLYLALPTVLFLLGWVRWYVSVPLSSAVLVAAWLTWSRAGVSPVSFSKKDWGCLALTVLGCMAWTELISFHGHGLQMSDFWARNPIAQTLVQGDWPVFNHVGRYFIYYLAWWLPPALLSKVFSGVNPATFFFLWAWLGVALACCVLFIRMRGRVLLFFVALTLLGSLFDWINFSGGSIWNHLGDAPCWKVLMEVNGYVKTTRFFVWCVELSQTFNHAIPVVVAVSLLCCKNLQKAGLPFVASLVVPCTAYGCISLLVLLCLRLWPMLTSWKGIVALAADGANWAAAGVLLVMAMYYGSSTGGSVTLLPLAFGSPAGLEWWRVMSAYLLNTVALLVPGLFFLCSRRFWRSAPFKTFVLLVIFTPVLRMGTDVNELMYKAGAVFYPCLALCCALWFRHESRQKRWLAVSVLVICSGATVFRVVQFAASYTWDETRMQANRKLDPPGKDYRDPDSWVGRFVSDRNFWSEQKPPLLFYQSEGESSQGVLAPFATGVKASSIFP